MSISAGFTGTQKGMTLAQAVTVADCLLNLQVIEVHHGLCIGADAQFHYMCQKLALAIHGHPPLDESKMATLTGFEELRAPKPYLMRNKEIVNGRDMLIATPYEYEEKIRSGTWSTIRYARKELIRVILILPDGSIA